MSSETWKLFLLGMPGSGKSIIAQDIVQYTMSQYNLSTCHINDYGILSEMYRNSRKSLYNPVYKRSKISRRFLPSKYGGFIVNDSVVYDEALQKLKRQVEEGERRALPGVNQLVLIEFARSDYQHAFQVLKPDFLMDASFLFLDGDIEVCMKRASQRVLKSKHKKSRNDYYVSRLVFDRYCRSNNSKYLNSKPFRNEYHVSDQMLQNSLRVLIHFKNCS